MSLRDALWTPSGVNSGDFWVLGASCKTIVRQYRATLSAASASRGPGARRVGKSSRRVGKFLTRRGALAPQGRPFVQIIGPFHPARFHNSNFLPSRGHQEKEKQQRATNLNTVVRKRCHLFALGV